MNIIRRWLDTKLPGWRSAWKLYSVQALSALASLITGWLALPEADRIAIASVFRINPGYLIVAGLIGTIYLRLKPQKNKDGTPIIPRSDP